MSTFSIREISVNEWERLRAIRLQALKANPAFSALYEKELKMTEQDWRDWILSHDTGIFIVLENDLAVGIMGIVIDKNDFYRKNASLWGFLLDEHLRRPGLKKMLYEAGIDRARAHPTIEKLLLPGHIAQEALAYGVLRRDVPGTTWHDTASADDVHCEVHVKDFSELAL
jgi:hypothetical protein